MVIYQDTSDPVVTQSILDAAIAGVSGGGVSDGDKGDIVVSSTGSVWSIDSGVMTAAGRALVDDADAAAQRTTLGLAAIAASGSASDLSTGTVPIARIPTGSTSSDVCVGNDSRLSDPRPLLETGDPAVLTPAVIPDGYLLQRDGTDIVGLDPSTLGGGSTPTGTGFVHVTSGTQDGTAQKVELNNSAHIDTTTKLPEAQGGTNQSTYAKGDLLYATGANTLGRLPTAANGSILSMVSGAPAWAGPGLEYLGSVTLGAAAVTTGAVAIAARDELLILVRVTGYSGADIASFRFNADSGANYCSRYIQSAAGGTALTNNQNVSQTLARIFATGVTTTRSAAVTVMNRSATIKTASVSGMTGSTNAATAPVIEFGGFQWVNTSAQITSVEMRTAGGANTLSAGSGFVVFGRNL